MKTGKIISILLSSFLNAAAWTAILSPAMAADWPQWRGPDRSNASTETGLLRQWAPEGPPLIWAVSGLGEGIASLSIEKGRLFTLGNHHRQEVAIALKADTGELIWSSVIGEAKPQNPLMRWLSPRTPTADGTRVFAITSAGDLACLRSADGAVFWRRNYRDDFGAEPPLWGFCDYPLLDKEKLICAPGGREAGIVALEKTTGRVLWKTKVPEGGRGSYAATFLLESQGVRQYVTYLENALVGVDAADGRVLWNYRGSVDRRANSYTPIRYGDLLVCANGYSGVLASIRLDHTGGAEMQVEEQYLKRLSLDPFQDCTVRVGDHLYTWERVGGPMCIDLKTGEVAWRSDRTLPRSRAAVTYADGHLYYLCSDGMMLLVEANPERYVEKGNFRIPKHQPSIGASFPVISGGRLYVRDDDELFCFDVSRGALEVTRPSTREIALTIPPPQDQLQGSRSSPAGEERALDAIYVPTPQDIVERMLRLGELGENWILYDLGSGDGRFLITAAKQYSCRAVGYELDPGLVSSSRAAVRKLDLEDFVRIEQADLFTADLSDADVVVVYLPSPLLARLLPQFERLKPGARVVSHQFEIPGIKPSSTHRFVSSEDGDLHTVFVWKAPLRRSVP